MQKRPKNAVPDALTSEAIRMDSDLEKARAAVQKIWPMLGLDYQSAAHIMREIGFGKRLPLGLRGVTDLSALQRWLDENPGSVTPSFLVRIASEGFDAGRSSVARRNAKTKNVEPRAWVLDQWASRTDVEQSKASFARQHAGLVKAKFKVDVTGETIARDWLPKTTES